MSITEQKELIPTLQTKLISIRQLILSSNESYSHSINEAIDQLSNSIRQSNPCNISITTLNPLSKIISLQNEQINYLILDTVRTIVNNHLLPQTSYTLILQLFTEILHKSINHRIVILELLMKMIESQSIQISTKNIQKLFKLGITIYSYPKHKKGSTEFLYNLITILFQFLDNLLRPVVFKKQKQTTVSHINLDLEDIKAEKKNTSFYTITESQSEMEQSQLPTDKEDLEEKNVEVDLSEYKDCDIYTSCIWVFQYLLNVINGKNKEIIFSKETIIDLLLGIIYTTQKLFFYMNDYIALIRHDLGKSLAGILQSNCDFNMRSKAIKLSYYLVSTFHYCYYIIPLCLNTRKHFSSIEKYICYEFISKNLKDTMLLSDLYILQLDNNISTDHIFDIILSFLSKDNLDAIALLPKGGTYTSITFLDKIDSGIYNDNNEHRNSNSSKINYNQLMTTSIHRSNYVSILIQICNSLEYTHLSILKSNKIRLDSFIANNSDHFTEEFKFIRKKISYYYPSVKNVLLFLINEKIKSTMNQYVDKLITYIKIYSVIHLDKARDELVDIMINIINNISLSNDSLIYLARELFSFAEQKQFNTDIESWLCIIHLMQVLFIRLNNSKGNGLFLPSPSIDIEIYLRFIEHHLRTFSFNYYETIFSSNSTDYEANTISDEIQSSCNNDLPTTHSMIESPETNYASVFANCIKIKKPLYFRKTSHNIPHPMSFIEPDSLACIADLIETFFISSSPSLGDEYLVSTIINGFIKNSINIIKKYSKTSEQMLQLKFNIIKITDIAASNISRINILWEKFIIILHEIFSIKDCEINVMILDALIIVSMLTIHSYQQVESLSDEWTMENYQNNIFISIRSFMELILKNKKEILHFAVDNLYFMIMHIGKKLTIESWGDYIHIVLFILQEIEDTYNVYSLCEQIFNTYFDIIKSEHTLLLVEMIQVLLIKSNNKVKESCLGHLLVFFKDDSNNNSEIGRMFIMKIKSILVMKIIDNDYLIRKKSLGLLMIGSTNQYILCSSSSNDFHKQLFLSIDKIYESYKDKLKKRGLVYDFEKKINCKCNSCKLNNRIFINSNNNTSCCSSDKNTSRDYDDTEMKDEYGFSTFKTNIEANHVELPTILMNIKETQEEKEWEDTLIQSLSILQYNDLCQYREVFYHSTINILFLASPKVLNQLIINQIHIQASTHHYQQHHQHNNEPKESQLLSALITHLGNYISSEFVYYNWPMHDSLIANFIQLLDIILDKFGKSIRISIIDLSMKLFKACKKHRDYYDFNDLSPNESLIFDFLSQCQNDYQLEIIEFYIRNIKLDNDFLFHSEILCITSVNKLLTSPLSTATTFLHYINMIHFACNGLIKLCYNKTFQQKYSFNQQLKPQPIYKFIFKSYTQITSIILRDDSTLQQLQLYDQMLQLSQYILSKQNDDILLLDISEYLTMELLWITEEKYSNARYRLISLITNDLFKVKNNMAVSLIVNNLLKQYKSKIAKELFGKFIKDKIEGFINEEKRDNMPIQKYKINELYMILTLINENIIEIGNIMEKDLKCLIKMELNILMESNEIQLVTFSKEIVDKILD